MAMWKSSAVNVKPDFETSMRRKTVGKINGPEHLSSGGISVDRVHGLCRMGPLCFVNSLRVVETMFLGK